VLRGKLENAQAGHHNGGPTPYGFDRLVVNAQGEEVERIPRGARVRILARGENKLHEVLCPIPEDDDDPTRQQERQTAIWLFQTFRDEDVAPRTLAQRLNTLGVPSPQVAYGKAGAWTGPTIEWMLQNPAYAGLQRWGRDAKGDYHRAVAGQSEVCESKGMRHVRNDKGINLNPIPGGGLVDRTLWDEVQEKLAGRKRKGWSSVSRGYALSGGLLRCGHCGAPMHGTARTTTYKGKQRKYRMYICDSAKKRPGTCRSYAIAEDKVLPALLKLLEEQYLAPEHLERLEATIRRRARARRQTDPSRLAALRADVVRLDDEVRRAVANVMRCRDNVDLLNDALTTLRQERDQVAAQLASLEHAQGVPDAEVAQRARVAVERLGKLRLALQKAPREKLAPILRVLVSSVKLNFANPPRPRQRYRFLGGVINLHPITELQETRGESPGEALEFCGQTRDA
jgi:hypothetical protein